MLPTGALIWQNPLRDTWVLMAKGRNSHVAKILWRPAVNAFEATLEAFQFRWPDDSPSGLKFNSSHGFKTAKEARKVVDHLLANRPQIP